MSGGPVGSRAERSGRLTANFVLDFVCCFGHCRSRRLGRLCNGRRRRFLRADDGRSSRTEGSDHVCAVRVLGQHQESWR